ncbi:MAG: HAMP domain-containing sensor histidine kinase [Actinomycetota bacterium]
MSIERRGRWRGLVARVTIAYAIGSLLLSVTVAGAAYALALNRLLDDAESQHRTQTYRNFKEVAAAVAATPPDASPEELDAVYARVLAERVRTNGSEALILLPNGETRGETIGRSDLPPTIVVQMGDGLLNPAQQRYIQNGEARYVVGTQLEEQNITYFEVVTLRSVQDTLRSLRRILFGVALLASVAGALLGWYAARRALAPLPRISNAARAIAGGDFDTRLDLQADPDLARLTEAFNGMVDAVGDRIDREQRFTSDVSHELRSPLMTVTASVEVLERRKESLPDVAQQAVDLLSQDLRRFQQLVEDLLEISRLEAGAVQLQLSRFLLAEFLEHVIALSQAPHLQLVYDPADGDLAITADKRRLQQVVTNLIDNAGKYGDGATAISFEAEGSTVSIIVEDEGPGVSADQRERIFERFGRVKEAAGNRSNATGFGLGLSLVGEHVRIHGGEVYVTDRIDGRHGARFVVQLPAGEHVDPEEEMAL